MLLYEFLSGLPSHAIIRIACQHMESKRKHQKEPDIINPPKILCQTNKRRANRTGTYCSLPESLFSQPPWCIKAVWWASRPLLMDRPPPPLPSGVTLGLNLTIPFQKNTDHDEGGRRPEKTSSAVSPAVPLMKTPPLSSLLTTHAWYIANLSPVRSQRHYYPKKQDGNSYYPLSVLRHRTKIVSRGGRREEKLP